MFSDPLAYFLTWHTYGSDHIGDRPDRVQHAQRRLKHPPLVLTKASRLVVHAVVEKHCNHCGWRLQACSVRTNHVHVVLSAHESGPEEVVRQLKAWATRSLRSEGLVEQDRKVWTDHASTRYLFSEQAIIDAASYTIKDQDRTVEHLRYKSNHNE